jgi:signal transduction histidine kinase
MIVRRWLRDTIARRYAATIATTIAIAMGMTFVALDWGGARPPLRETGLLERADQTVRMMDAAPLALRGHLAEAAGSSVFRVAWIAADSADAAKIRAAATLDVDARLEGFQFDGAPRRTAYFQAAETPPSELPLNYDRTKDPDARFFAVSLRDESWIVFTTSGPLWGIPKSTRVVVAVGILLLSMLAVSTVATLALTRPIKRFTEAVNRFAVDSRSSPMRAAGPVELRAAIGAFNAMQAQVQKFVDDRTSMLAAISHDLRTPLTRMRLRGELIDDEDQRRRHFRDVDDMRAMIDSALSFFRDELRDEESTSFDFPELLRTIADDYGDDGVEIPYDGPERAGYRGRPFALKRAFANLIDNAVKYASGPEIRLRREPAGFRVTVRDHGPGIPAAAAEQVFQPFQRLEGSRNRATGGVGLGLTSARAVIRGHGGDVVLRNRPEGGLDVEVSLPTA